MLKSDFIPLRPGFSPGGIDCQEERMLQICFSLRFDDVASKNKSLG